jgi:hypothetical protein
MKMIEDAAKPVVATVGAVPMVAAAMAAATSSPRIMFPHVCKCRFVCWRFRTVTTQEVAGLGAKVLLIRSGTPQRWFRCIGTVLPGTINVILTVTSRSLLA